MTAVIAPSKSHEPLAQPGQHTVLPGQTPEGNPILSVLLKRSYKITPGSYAERARGDRPLTPGDVPWNEPQTSSVKFESDLVPFKLATDVVLNGKVYAPGGKPCEQTLAELHVEQFSKSVLVTGTRRAIFTGGKPQFTDPQPFNSIELKYEFAYGGVDVFSDRNCQYPYPRNPLGLGFIVANTREAVDRRVLPNLEDPANPLTSENLCLEQYMQRWEAQPAPASFGWFPKTWLPRAALAGVMPGDRATERELRKAYAQLVPPEQRGAYEKAELPDMNFQFFNGASAGLSLPYLCGGERIATRNLTPDGSLDFHLPTDKPQIGIDIGLSPGSGPSQPQVVLHTVMIHMETRELDLVWRAAIDYPGPDWLPQMQKLEVVIQ